MSVLKVRGIRHDAASTDAINLDSSGNVGIGTATPDALLHVYQTGGKVATFGNNVNNNGTYVVLAGSSSNKNWAIANNMIAGGALEFVQTSATGGTTIGATSAMKIDSSGRVAMPYQPAFFVRMSTSGQVTNNVLPFNTEDLDVGSNYNTSTYRFTAPVSGVYQLQYGINCINAGGTFLMRKNGSTLPGTSANQETGSWIKISTSIITQLSAGDYVDVYHSGNGNDYDSTNYNFFTGHLIG